MSRWDTQKWNIPREERHCTPEECWWCVGPDKYSPDKHYACTGAVSHLRTVFYGASCSVPKDQAKSMAGYCRHASIDGPTRGSRLAAKREAEDLEVLTK